MVDINDHQRYAADFGDEIERLAEVGVFYRRTTIPLFDSGEPLFSTAMRAAERWGVVLGSDGLAAVIALELRLKSVVVFVHAKDLSPHGLEGSARELSTVGPRPRPFHRESTLPNYAVR
ncbi:hypothetical protein [Halococcus hamelinensis]|uniref:hypothetical protein n=1 Tax=Halococcus hamelinensis TaxID=332168 RepID=UPI000B2E8C82|nr:hypothetical protein [Halococcus hamelinensis]